MAKRKNRTPPATITDVARELGLSVATVSRALSRPELLRPQTRERVMSVVQRLNYRPNLVARALRKGHSHIILFVAPNLSPFFLEIFTGAEEVARSAQYSLLLGNSSGKGVREEEFFAQVEGGRAAGIILLTGRVPAPYLSGERPLPPLVTVLERPAGLAAPWVHTDHFAGALTAVQHLISLGHRRIAHITGLRSVLSTAHRMAGYVSALSAAGLAAPQAFTHGGDFTTGSGAAAIQDLIRLPTPPTAVLCDNDEMAYGAICALGRLGLSVPTHMSVVGFDNQNMAGFYNPPLTTVNIPRYELGQRAARGMIDQLAGRKVEPEVILPTTLVVRESTAPPAPHKPPLSQRQMKGSRR